MPQYRSTHDSRCVSSNAQPPVPKRPAYLEPLGCNTTWDAALQTLELTGLFSFFRKNLEIGTGAWPCTLTLKSMWASPSTVSLSTEVAAGSYVQGPYLLSRKGSLAQSWRAFEDLNSAFMCAIIRAKTHEDRYIQPCIIAHKAMITRPSFETPPLSVVPVTSRLYFNNPSLS